MNSLSHVVRVMSGGLTIARLVRDHHLQSPLETTILLYIYIYIPFIVGNDYH